MANVQIPNLPAVAALSGAELFEGVQAGTSVKISLDQIVAASRSGNPTTLPIPVSLGGTGVSTITGYVKGSGTTPFTGSATIPNTDITGLGTMSTQDASAVAITGGSITGITDLAVADGGTGASDAAGARTNLGLGTISTQNADAVAITGGSITGITDLAVADGGTGASDAAGARTNLGLGTMSTQNANTVSITGGSITGSTALAVADGGTGQGNPLTQYGLIYGSTTTAMASTAAGTSTQVLHGNASGAPTFSAVSLTADVSGTLPVANGGTGVTTAPAAAAVLMGFTTTATASGTTVLTNASSQFQLFTGTLTQTITLPVTSTLGTGWSFHIANNSTGTLTVNSSGGNLVISVIAGLSAMVTCIGTTLTTAADWEAGFTDFPSITGTGANVLATGPTITSGVYSGTVGASNPSTGVFTTLSSNDLTIPAATTEARSIDVGLGRSGNGSSSVSLIGDATYTTYGMRAIRGTTGANADSSVLHRGTGTLILNAIDAGSIEFYTTNTRGMRIGPTQSVTVDSLAGTGSRAVNASATGVLSATSDSRLKHEVEDAPIPGLAEIMLLEPKAYQWLDDIEKRGENAAVEIGFFADQVKDIIPSAAPMGNDGYYGFYDRSVVAALTKGMQEQQAVIVALEARLIALEKLR